MFSIPSTLESFALRNRTENPVWKTVLVYGKTVVLTRYKYAAGFFIPYRVIEPVVTEFHFVGCPARCPGEELMPEAYPPKRQFAHQIPRHAYRPVERFGVSGAVRNQQGIRLAGQDFRSPVSLKAERLSDNSGFSIHAGCSSSTPQSRRATCTVSFRIYHVAFKSTNLSNQRTPLH